MNLIEVVATRNFEATTEVDQCTSFMLPDNIEAIYNVEPGKASFFDYIADGLTAAINTRWRELSGNIFIDEPATLSFADFVCDMVTTLLRKEREIPKFQHYEVMIFIHLEILEGVDPKGYVQVDFRGLDNVEENSFALIDFLSRVYVFPEPTLLTTGVPQVTLNAGSTE